MAGARSLSALSRFLAAAPWDPQALAHAWLARFRKQLLPQVQGGLARLRAAQPVRRGRKRRLTVPAFVCFDDSVVPKAVQGEPNRRMEGGGRHSSSTEKRVVQGHSLVAGLLLLLGRRCPLALRL